MRAPRVDYEVGAHGECLMIVTIPQAEGPIRSVLDSPMPAVAEEARTVLPLFDGQRLRLARESLGVTQRGLADAIEGRVTAAALSQFERATLSRAPEHWPNWRLPQASQ